MKVLMFGWEFPPKILGGLAVASYGITKGLSLQGDVETTFCLPKPTGEEEKFLHILGMNQVPIVWRDVDYDYLKSRLPNYTTPEEYYSHRDHIYADFSYMNVNDLGCMEFAGGYPKNLHEEINNYSIIAGVVARTREFDIIHAHDWLTYPAGVHAKMVSGKPLCIHVHATDFDDVFRTLLHGDTAQECNHLFLWMLYAWNSIVFRRQWIYRIVHSYTLAWILMIVIDYSLTSQFRYTHDTICMVHTILFD